MITSPTSETTTYHSPLGSINIKIMKTFKIRVASKEDAIFIHNIHTKAARITCAKSYSKSQIDAWLEKRKPEGYYDGINKKEMFIAEIDEIVVGFGHTISGIILAIFVDPDHQGLGLGKELLNYASTIAFNNSSDVTLEATPNAFEFYRKHGFIKVSDGKIIRNKTELEVVIMKYDKKTPPNSA